MTSPYKPSMLTVLNNIRSFCEEDSDGPMISFAHQLTDALDQLVDTLAKFDEKMSEDDKIAASQAIDVITGTAVFVATLKLDRKNAIDKIIDGYSFAMASRFFDLPPIDISDRYLAEKINICKQMINAEHQHRVSQTQRIKKESASMADEIIAKMKTLN